MITSYSYNNRNSQANKKARVSHYMFDGSPSKTMVVNNTVLYVVYLFEVNAVNCDLLTFN